MKKLFTRGLSIVLLLSMTPFIKGCSNTEEEVTNVLWNFKTNGSILSSPVIYENNIIFGSNDKNLYSVDLNTHEKKWSFQSDAIITTTPIVDGNKVIFATKSSCYMLDLNSGKEVWKFTGEGNSVDAKDKYDYHSPSPILYKESVIFTSKEGTIYAISKELGEVKWKYKGDGASDLLATPSIQNNILCFGDTKGNCYAMDLETQKTLWKKSIGKDYVYITFAYKDYSYFSGRDAVLDAFDLKSGEKKWSYKEPVGSWLSGDIIVKDDLLYVAGSDNQSVRLFEYNTGKEIKSYIGKGNIFSKPIIENDELYFSAGSAYNKNIGGIYGFDLKQGGKKIFEQDMKTAVFSSLAIKDNIAYFGGVDGNLYAIKLK